MPAKPPSSRVDKHTTTDLVGLAAAHLYELQHGASMRYVPDLLSAAHAATAFVALQQELSFERRAIVIFGQKVEQPRLIAWAGERPYRYSGQTLPSRAWTASLQTMLELVNQHTGIAFNHVLVNFYRDGQDSMGFHADDEAELGINPCIATVSLGASRRFTVSRRDKTQPERLNLWLEAGSLLLMQGTMQHHYVHGIPKTTAAVGPRMSLTFRTLFDHPSRRT